MNREDDFCELLSEVRSEAVKSSYLKDDLSRVIERLDILQSKNEEVAKEVLRHKVDMAAIRRSILTVGALITLTVGVCSFYYEYLTDRPSPYVQQTDIDNLWLAYDKIADERYASTSEELKTIKALGT